jgi:asparagine synthase (glutamine-hydrolysing)
MDAMKRALQSSQPEIMNTDQGVQFTSAAFIGLLEDKNIRISMDGRGRAFDNIFIERLWRTVKYDEVYIHQYTTVSDARRHLERYFVLTEQAPLTEAPDRIAAELRLRLEKAVQKRISSDEIGCYLSGGLDSSVMAALARPHVKRLWTVAAGVAGAPDLAYAREVADFIKSDHTEVIVTFEDMLRVLPDVIWHLESFDALLVRSSIMQYFASQQIRQYSTEAFSGEGGDKLFAGYAYLKDLPRERLDAELIDITNRFHNTALQRVDRCLTAYGLRAHVCFLDMDAVELAIQIPIDLKLRGGVEKWILREAVSDILPERVLRRTKAKFWEGAGVQDLLANHAESAISDSDFARERTLPNGWVLGGKEELMYYRIYREQLGPFANLDWMGRTPVS